MHKSNVSTNMVGETFACTTEDLQEVISNVIFRDDADKQCVRSPATGVASNDTGQGPTLQMESEELLGVICLAANADVNNGEGTANGDTPICIVASNCVTKTEAGTKFVYDINWEPSKVQPGLIGGEHCFALKSGETWVPYCLPKLATWRYFTASIIFYRLERMNDGVAVRDLVKHTHVLLERLAEKREIRLNDFFYDREECSQQWVVFDSRGVGDGVFNDNDARRDTRWGWLPSTIPCEYGEIRMIVHDLMGNCWSTIHRNDDFISRYLEFEMLESFDVVTGEPTIPLENPVFSPIVEGKVFLGEDNICLRHVRGREVTYDGLFVDIWDPDRTTSDRLYAIDISGTVIPQSELNRHLSDTGTGYAVVDKSTPACGTMRSDGSRRMGQGTKRKATTRSENGGTTTVVGRGGGGNGRGGGVTMAGGRGRGRGRGQGGTTMDGETKRKIGGRQGALRRNRRPGQAAVAEMRRLQRSTNLCITYRPFVRLVREIVNKEEVATNPMRFGMLAIRALLEAAEAYLVHLMESTNEVAIHSKRVTILMKDMRLVDALQKPQGIHYDNEEELVLLRERAPAYFNVTLLSASALA
ncbi:hypothetical protein CBR_g23904 [Chara braunii]|uniref:Core Histone H2A/H2B/H3 domain-containing protein n=1 Tax=Chara braunii TaxID=69332 RepID=A0A388L578_CHABU|nr:hypothetical protein CBR_g23904 [Chara braunii]|eukprot:GBG77455.1 hypothetical protein CBR_g23904 [Chara braunii]